MAWDRVGLYLGRMGKTKPHNDWTVTSTRPDGGVHSDTFATEAEARAHAEELARFSHTETNVVWTGAGDRPHA